MNSEPIDETYFTWLYEQVAATDSSSPVETYWHLLNRMYKTEFLYIVDRDDNRAEDGIALRGEFLEETGLDADEDWMELGCSILELLISLARRLAFTTEGEPRSWFWEMISNLGLVDCHDATRMSEERVEAVLNGLIWRTYKEDGSGGLFPLKRPSKDQKNVELWDQMSEYILETD